MQLARLLFSGQLCEPGGVSHKHGRLQGVELADCLGERQADRYRHHPDRAAAEGCGQEPGGVHRGGGGVQREDRVQPGQLGRQAGAEFGFHPGLQAGQASFLGHGHLVLHSWYSSSAGQAGQALAGLGDLDEWPVAVPEHLVSVFA